MLVKRSLASTSEVRNLKGIRSVCTASTVAHSNLVLHDYMFYEITRVQDCQACQSLATQAKCKVARLEGQERDG